MQVDRCDEVLQLDPHDQIGEALGAEVLQLDAVQPRHGALLHRVAQLRCVADVDCQTRTAHRPQAKVDVGRVLRQPGHFARADGGVDRTQRSPRAHRFVDTDMRSHRAQL